MPETITDTITTIENTRCVRQPAEMVEDGVEEMTPEKKFDAQKKLFLKALSVSGDILAAAIAAGHEDDVLFFQERQCSVAFYAEWDAAMDTAYLRLESALVSNALKAATQSAAENDPPADLRTTAMWHRLGLSLLAARRLLRRRTQGQNQGRSQGQPQNLAAHTRGAMLSRLNLMRERTEAREAERQSADAQSANMAHKE